MGWKVESKKGLQRPYVNDERAKHRHASEHDCDVVFGVVKCVSNRVCPIGLVFLIELVFELLREAGDGYSCCAVIHVCVSIASLIVWREVYIP